MEIRERDVALALGLKRYFTGEPCSHGHVCERITSNKACLACHRRQSKKHRSDNPDKTRARLRLYREANREAIASRAAKRRRADPEKYREQDRLYREANLAKALEKTARCASINKEKYAEVTAMKRKCNPEPFRLASERWRLKHPEKYKEVTRRSNAKAFAENRELLIAHIRKRKARLAHATPAWADMKAIAEKYKQARTLSEETGVVHVVDHIYPIQGKLVCGLNIATNMQVITSAENRKKSNRMPTEAELAS